MEVEAQCGWLIHSQQGIYIATRQDRETKHIDRGRADIQEALEKLGNKEGYNHGVKDHEGKGGDEGQFGKERNKFQHIGESLSPMQHRRREH
ncbi:hypothetical protein ACS0TY_011812 [Phlomoides rotata]